MGRRPNPQRKQDLLEEIVAYLGLNGLGDMSLRPLARQLGTSTYTLTYQFGSKDELLAEAVDFAQARQLGVIGQWATETPRDSASALLGRYWRWLHDEDNLRISRMLIEASTLAHNQPFAEIGRRGVQQWIAALSEAFAAQGIPDGSGRLATRTYAALVGLQIDLIATGEGVRVEAAFNDLCDSLDLAMAGAVAPSAAE